MQRIVDLVEHQVIAAVRSEEEMLIASESDANVIFLLSGTIVNLGRMMDIARSGDKHVFLHLEFMEGIAADKSGMKYIAQSIKPAGVISTRSHAIVMAKDNGLLAIQRLFLIDSTAIRNGIKSIHSSGADAVEVMPGVIPHMVSELTELTPLPIIAGGLVRNRQEIAKALEAGALAVSVGEPLLWRN